ncbi:hypothetical protein N7462_007741 [Penicillium macrosclerotiorum]|uniref:uncharacterized protein n=1 Tax=Penicillium macrosclerotiorum TaxID=303699 RepID=UPI002548F055|nr:uncharacterized protein N7462_007741 [Penicillium macrosclerotiorum]KAJ5679497.1 hypothetical protein N7462_007741 [Penicillium macrosclerotiorum]
MPPSTVFSYWRRDHRRSTAPASLLAPTLAPKGAAESPINTPPQLPEIPDTPTLTSPFEDGPPSLDAPPWIDSPVEQDASKLSYNTTSIPLSSSASLAAPSPLAERDSRPHSSPEEHNPELVFTSQPNTSQLSVSGLRPDQGDGDLNSKPTSPFRLSFGKGLRNLQAPSNDLQKRSPTAGSGQSHFRLRSSPEDSPADRVNLSQRDFKTDGG